MLSFLLLWSGLSNLLTLFFDTLIPVTLAPVFEFLVWILLLLSFLWCLLSLIIIQLIDTLFNILILALVFLFSVYIVLLL